MVIVTPFSHVPLLIISTRSELELDGGMRMEITVDSGLVTGTGVDPIDAFLLNGKIDTDGKMTLHKSYVDYEATWDYTGCVTPWGIVGLYEGGIIWLWKVEKT